MAAPASDKSDGHASYDYTERGSAQKEGLLTKADGRTVMGFTKLQAFYRREAAVRRVADLKRLTFSRHYDSPYGLGGMELEMSAEDEALLRKDQEMLKLKQILESKEREVDILKHQLTDKVALDTQQQRITMARVEGAEHRTQDIDEWSMEEVIAWFIEEGLEEYADVLARHRVDGKLLVHLDKADWPDLGITKKIHMKRLELLLAPYRQRWQKQRAADKTSNEHASLLDMAGMRSVHQELAATEESRQPDIAEDKQSNTVIFAEDEVKLPVDSVGEDQEWERKDSENMSYEVVYQESNELPSAGNVIQAHYNCFLVESSKLIESSRANRGRPFEFILGAGQAILGWDRCLTKISRGSRVKLTVRSSYAYGSQGRPPLIPPEANLLFDIELLSFRSRRNYVKPVVQAAGLSTISSISKASDVGAEKQKVSWLGGSLASKNSPPMPLPRSAKGEGKTQQHPKRMSSPTLSLAITSARAII